MFKKVHGKRLGLTMFMFSLKKRIQRIPLKWILFVFYLFLGFLPLVAVSYMTLAANIQSIEDTTKLQMQAALTQIGLRIESQYIEAKDDLESFVKIFSISISKEATDKNFSFFSRQILIKFLADHEQFEMICLYNWDSSIIAMADRELVNHQNSHQLVDQQMVATENERLINKLMNPDSRYLPMIFDVSGIYKHPRQSGYILALIPIRDMAEVFFSADLGDFIEKQIIDITKQNLWGYTPDSLIREKRFSKIQEYVAPIESLGWTLVARIPEAVIFKDIIIQRNKNFGLVLLISIAAAGVVYGLGTRTTRQIRHILDGTRQFASGNLSHRLEIPVGRELMGLSVELNNMAKDLEIREKNLVQTNKLASLGLFTAGIAHEIKNPLAGIKTSAQVLEQMILIKTNGMNSAQDKFITIDAETIEDAKKLSAGITKEANRLNKLLKDLVDFSKPANSKKQWVDVNVIVDRALTVLQSEFSSEEIIIIKRIQSFKAFLDPDQFIQILVNILLNAKQAVIGKQGEISIFSTFEKDPSGKRYRSISIQDNGPGIPKEAITKLFDPFFSLSGKGTGLGLSIVYTLSKFNGLSINVYNRPEGGAEFILTFQDEAGKEG